MKIKDIINKLENIHQDVLLSIQDRIRTGDVQDLYNLNYSRFAKQDDIHSIVGDVLRMTHGLDMEVTQNGQTLHLSAYEILDQINAELQNPNINTHRQRRLETARDSISRLINE